MKRHEARKISRSIKNVEALGPCVRYSNNAGVNPFYSLLASLSLQLQVTEGVSQEEAEKKVHHQIKMKTEQKAAKARQQRKRNKV